MVARRAGDEALAKRAEAVASRTYELSELLIDVLNVRDVGADYPHPATYHPSCGSRRMLRVGDKPSEHFATRGLTLVELRMADSCCGFGGTFAIKNADMSTAMLADMIPMSSRPGRRCVLPATRPASCTSVVDSGGSDQGSARCIWPKSSPPKREPSR